MFILKKGHQPGVYVPLRALFLVYNVFLCFSLIFKVFIIIHEYANYRICIVDHGIKGLWLIINLAPCLVAYGK